MSKRAARTGEKPDELILRAEQRLLDRRAHAERVLHSGGDIEGANAVVVRLENALKVLKAYRTMCGKE